MIKKYLQQRLCQFLQHMCLADRCLCLFLLLLLIQSVSYIFWGPDTANEFDAMDAMIRSSTATIFGYFISKSFGMPTGKTETESPLESREKSQPASPHTKEPPCCIRQQIIIVAGVGLFSLIVLGFARTATLPSQNSITSLSQFQDFLVGSIGFLVGHGKYEQT